MKTIRFPYLIAFLGLLRTFGCGAGGSGGRHVALEDYPAQLELTLREKLTECCSELPDALRARAISQNE